MEFKLNFVGRDGKWVNLHKSDFTAVESLRILWQIVCASSSLVHNKFVLHPQIFHYVSTRKPSITITEHYYWGMPDQEPHTGLTIAHMWEIIIILYLTFQSVFVVTSWFPRPLYTLKCSMYSCILTQLCEIFSRYVSDSNTLLVP